MCTTSISNTATTTRSSSSSIHHRKKTFSTSTWIRLANENNKQFKFIRTAFFNNQQSGAPKRDTHSHTYSHSHSLMCSIWRMLKSLFHCCWTVKHRFIGFIFLFSTIILHFVFIQCSLALGQFPPAINGRKPHQYHTYPYMKGEWERISYGWLLSYVSLVFLLLLSWKTENKWANLNGFIHGFPSFVCPITLFLHWSPLNSFHFVLTHFSFLFLL